MTLRGGAARLGPAVTGALMLGLVPLWLWRYELGGWPSVDADARDRLWDFRATGRERAREAAQLWSGRGVASPLARSRYLTDSCRQRAAWGCGA